MKKKTLALLAGASLMALAGNASAFDVNIYGASAQFTFWDTLGKAYLESQGCTNVQLPVHSTDGKHGIVHANSGTGVYAGGANLRYSSKASFDGVFATMGSCNGQTGCNPDPDGCGTQSRKMITSNTNTALSCQPITIGASDVAPASFTQQSHGQVFGPLGGGNVDRVFTGVKTPSNVLAKHGGIVVPFGFFVNNSVQLKKCSTAAAANAGLQCGSDADCGGTAGACVAGNIDSISREMATNIFNANSAYYWSDFGAGYTVTGTTQQTDDFIVACLRHAGSGTAATMDYSVMNSKWGLGLATQEQPTLGGLTETVFFNDGSTDLMRCVNGNGSWNGKGAIGYSDADQKVPAPGGTDAWTNSYAVNYNGVVPSRVNVRNGMYDFFTNEWLFINTNTYPSTSAQYQQFNNLIAFASNPANINYTNFAGKSNYWTTVGEMKFNKTSDQLYPSYTGAANPMTP